MICCCVSRKKRSFVDFSFRGVLQFPGILLRSRSVASVRYLVSKQKQLSVQTDNPGASDLS